MTDWLLYLAILLAVYVVGFVRGMDAGTTDTERRWSDAVGRADAERERKTTNARNGCADVRGGQRADSPTWPGASERRRTS